MTLLRHPDAGSPQPAERLFLVIDEGRNQTLTRRANARISKSRRQGRTRRVHPLVKSVLADSLIPRSGLIIKRFFLCGSYTLPACSQHEQMTLLKPQYCSSGGVAAFVCALSSLQSREKIRGRIQPVPPRTRAKPFPLRPRQCAREFRQLLDRCIKKWLPAPPFINNNFTAFWGQPVHLSLKRQP
jgi:hypothetical protein